MFKIVHIYWGYSKNVSPNINSCGSLFYQHISWLCTNYARMHDHLRHEYSSIFSHSMFVLVWFGKRSRIFFSYKSIKDKYLRWQYHGWRNSLENVVLLQQRVVQLLRNGCFELEKWASNCSTVIQNIQREGLVIDSFFKPNDGQASSWVVLGFRGKLIRLSVYCHGNTAQKKRSILSTVAQLY